MQRYPNNDIAFIGIWGAENSDKSFFYDRILNLTDIHGDNVNIHNIHSLLILL